jgi:hypothetical protein
MTLSGGKIAIAMFEILDTKGWGHGGGECLVTVTP